MSIESILTEIDAEIARLKEVRSLLAGSGRVASTQAQRRTGKAAAKAGKRRTLSADARKRIAEAQRKRWAAQKAKSK